MKFEKISQEDREKLERRLYKTIVEEFRREKIKDGYYKYIVIHAIQDGMTLRDRYMVKHAGERIRNDIERQRTRDRKCICGPYI